MISGSQLTLAAASKARVYGFVNDSRFPAQSTGRSAGSDGLLPWKHQPRKWAASSAASDARPRTSGWSSRVPPINQRSDDRLIQFTANARQMGEAEDRVPAHACVGMASEADADGLRPGPIGRIELSQRWGRRAIPVPAVGKDRLDVRLRPAIPKWPHASASRRLTPRFSVPRPPVRAVQLSKCQDHPRPSARPVHRRVHRRSGGAVTHKTRCAPRLEGLPCSRLCTHRRGTGGIL